MTPAQLATLKAHIAAMQDKKQTCNTVPIQTAR